MGVTARPRWADIQSKPTTVAGFGITDGQPVLSTAVASTSGVAIDFTGIPSWAKRVTIMLNGVSTTGTSALQVQLGAGSIDAVGYASGGLTQNAGGTLSAYGSTTGYVVVPPQAATGLYHGQIELSLCGTNTWSASAAIGCTGNTFGAVAGGTKTLAGALDRLRITTAGGVDTFDAGSINIMWE